MADTPKDADQRVDEAIVHDDAERRRGLICAGCGKPFGPKLHPHVEVEDGRPVLVVEDPSGHSLGVIFSWDGFGEFLNGAMAALASAPPDAIARINREQVMEMEVELIPIGRTGDRTVH